MKKYHQLLLLVLSVTSILCFVFYKHEYDRLRRVLEVLDFFGPPVDAISVKSILDDEPSSTDGSLQIVTDVWQKYSDDAYFYSATRTVNEKGWSMSSFAVFKRDGASSLKKLSCALISGDTVEDKFEGTIEWKELGSDSSISAYEMICNVPEVPGRSHHLLSLYEANSIHSPLNLPLNAAPEPLIKQTTSICAISKDAVWRPSETIDFIRYHAALGVESFSVYHRRGVSNEVLSSLKALLSIRRDVKISLIPWNTPVQTSLSLDYSIVSHACAAKHIAKSGPVIVMPWSHFLAIPNDLKTFLHATREDGSEKVHALNVEIQPLCSNVPRGEGSSLAQHLYLKKHITQPKNGTLRWLESQNPYAKTVETKIDALIAKLVSFEPCPLNGNEKIGDDEIVLAFSAIAQKEALHSASAPHLK